MRLIFSIGTIDSVFLLSTVQVDEETKKKLFSYAAKLQEKSGRKVSLSEAINNLLDSQESDRLDKSKVLSLYGILKGEEADARKALGELRQEQ